MSGYDGSEFLRRVQAHQLHVRGRTAPTGCWVCDVLMPRADRGVRAFEAELRRCEEVSGGIVDAHHVLPKRVIKTEFPHGVYTSFDGTAIPMLPAREIGDENWRRFRESHFGGALEERTRELDELLMDPRNGILVRRFHHDALEHRTLAIPVALLPADTLEFVDELGLRWWLENQEARRGR